jgi:hypothetical protein
VKLTDAHKNYSSSQAIAEFSLEKSRSLYPILIHFEKIFTTLSKNPQICNTILIRYRGAFGENRIHNNTDYEVLSGDISIDSDVIHAIAKGQGKDPSQLLEKLNRGFEILWNHRINNFLLKIPKGRQEFKRLWISLQFAARYFAAVEQNSPITISMGDKSVSIPPIHNENNLPDLNLTLLAVLNDLQPQKMQAMVHKVDGLIRSTEST